MQRAVAQSSVWDDWVSNTAASLRDLGLGTGHLVQLHGWTRGIRGVYISHWAHLGAGVCVRECWEGGRLRGLQSSMASVSTGIAGSAEGLTCLACPRLLAEGGWSGPDGCHVSPGLQLLV